MGAAVHRLDLPRSSAFTAEQREEIQRTAAANVTNRAQDQRELADRVMRQPIEDGLTKWKREAEEAAAAERRAAERTERERSREQRRALDNARQNWADWIGAEVERRVAEVIRGQRDTNLDLLKLLDQHNEAFERIATRLDEVKRENVVLRGELAQARENFAALFAGVTQRLATLEKDTMQNSTAVAAGLRAVSVELAQLKAMPLLKLYLEDERRD